MSRLIDADALIETIKKDFSSKFLNVKQFDNGSKSFMECFIETVKSVPTAYDLDKVVAEFEEIKMNYFLTIANTGSEKLDIAYGYASETINRALDIVRKGGVENE